MRPCNHEHVTASSDPQQLLCKRGFRAPSAALPPVQQFLLAELGTSGSLDGTQRLIVKGRFLPKVFETVLRR